MMGERRNVSYFFFFYLSFDLFDVLPLSDKIGRCGCARSSGRVVTLIRRWRQWNPRRVGGERRLFQAIEETGRRPVRPPIGPLLAIRYDLVAFLPVFGQPHLDGTNGENVQQPTTASERPHKLFYLYDLLPSATSSKLSPIICYSFNFFYCIPPSK
jgi:hypothetical protein